MYQAHHMIPVSLLGADKQSNLIKLNKGVHRNLHQTLDIPMNRYKSYTRRLKEKTNEHMVMRPETVDMIGDIQKEFFLNIGDLPTRLVQKHVTKFMQMVEEERIKYENITGDEYDKPKRIIDKVDQVHELHHFYIGCKKDISKELLQIMKKNIGQRA